MSSFQPISRERHGQQRWKRQSSYAFAAVDSIVPLVGAELPTAALSMPIVFVEQGDGYVSAAFLGLQSGNNLFVSADGRWLGAYVPAALRSYPFRLAKTEDGQQVLCIDEGSGLLTDGPEGERFFADDGQPAKEMANILNFLTQIEQNRVATAAACAVLQKHHLLRPWTITLKNDAGEQPIVGLFKIDEAALNLLPGDAFLELRQVGALPMAYGQLFSMQHLPRLGQLVEARAKASAQTLNLQHLAPDGNLDLEFFNKGGTFNFGGL